MERSHPKIELSGFFLELKELLPQGQPSEIRRKLIDYLQCIREELSVPGELYSPEEKNHMYATGISLRGVLDYINLREITSRENWEADHQTLDLVWTRMWDCKQRMESYRAIAGGYVNSIFVFLESLAIFFRKNFGPGSYMSPEIKVKRVNCSLCDDNIKKCNHIPGFLYNGHMCRQIFVDFEALGVSLVANPEDPRCRIWPWNSNEENRTFKVTILTTFVIDDFIQDEDWPGVDISWPEGTSRSNKMPSASDVSASGGGMSSPL